MQKSLEDLEEKGTFRSLKIKCLDNFSSFLTESMKAEVTEKIVEYIGTNRWHLAKNILVKAIYEVCEEHQVYVHLKHLADIIGLNINETSILAEQLDKGESFEKRLRKWIQRLSPVPNEEQENNLIKEHPEIRDESAICIAYLYVTQVLNQVPRAKVHGLNAKHMNHLRKKYFSRKKQ